MANVPAAANAHRLRAIELRKQGKLADALREIEQALRVHPQYPEGYYNLASIRYELGRFEDAADAWRRATELRPTYYQAYAALGTALRRLGRLDEAIAAGQHAARLCPTDVDVHVNLANTLHVAHRMQPAAAEFKVAMKLNPRSILVLNNYANLLADLDQPARAIELLRRAIAIEPSRAELYNNLGNLLKSQAKIDEAIDCFRRTLAAKRDAVEVHSNLLLTLNCHARSDSGLLTEHVEWARRHAERFYPHQPRYPNDRNPDRRLRIGYVSADFRRHSAAYFIEPIVQAHDRDRVEVFCYSCVSKPDDMTSRIQSRADVWRSIVGVPDDRAAQIIRDDRIDILVDLSGHTAYNRLLLFARKPAPIQVTYLGYPNTTGLATMDYRLTDTDADPPGATDALHTENLVRLPRGFLCYRPADNSPPPRDPAAHDAGRVTFGTFNNFAKVTTHMIGLWSQILLHAPGSSLLIKAETLGDDQTRRDVHGAFESHGVDAPRVELLGRVPSFLRHLATYHRVDIGLDTFPYNGTTTTCEAMCMGVPVITLAGKAHVSRVGASLLKRVGLEDLIATSDEQYVQKAAALAGDASRRAELSSSLRQRMSQSDLTNAGAFVQDLENAYRRMWHEWIRRS